MLDRQLLSRSSSHCKLLLWMSFLHVIGFGLKVGHLLLMLCCWLFSVISMNWFINGGIMETKIGFLGDGTKIWVKFWEMISEITSKIHHRYYQYIGSKREKNTVEEPFDHLDCFLDLSVFVCVLVHSSEAVEKRKETFASMCDERARMLQDQFNVSMNHVQAMSIVISTFHHGKRLSAIDQGFRSSLSSANLCFCGLELYQVEAKYPALLFKQQLTTYVKKIYGIV